MLETEETEEEAPGANTRGAGQGGEMGPNAAKTRSREEAPAARAEESTRASPPIAHPTATPRPPDRTEPTTPATNAEISAEAGRARDPQKPTIPTKMLTPPDETPTPPNVSHPTPWRSALGDGQRRLAGAQGWAPESFCLARPGAPPKTGFHLAKENP